MTETADTTPPAILSAVIDYNDNWSGNGLDGGSTLIVYMSETVNKGSLNTGRAHFHLNDVTGTDLNPGVGLPAGTVQGFLQEDTIFLHKS